MLNSNGFLPEGIHELTLDQIKARFGSFNGSDRRVRLFERLADYVSRVSGYPWYRGLIVDGSFVTSKTAPSDIDLILIVDPELALGNNLRPGEYNLLSSRQTRRVFGFDVFAAPESSTSLQSWLEYFSQVRGSSERKGIVRLSP